MAVLQIAPLPWSGEDRNLVAIYGIVLHKQKSHRSPGVVRIETSSLDDDIAALLIEQAGDSGIHLRPEARADDEGTGALGE